MCVCQQYNSKSCRGILVKSRGGGEACNTGNKRLHFGDDPDHDTDPGFFLPLRNGDTSCKNFARSTASAEVCGLRVLLVQVDYRVFFLNFICLFGVTY